VNIGVSVNEVLVKPAITDLRESHLKDKIALFTQSGIIKIILAEAPRRKGKIIIFVFLFAPLRELFLSVRAIMAEFTG